MSTPTPGSQPPYSGLARGALKQMPAVATNLKEVREFFRASYDQATGYGRVILGLGYVGFFTLWAGTRLQVGAKFPRLLLWSALLLALSLLFYILFEIAQIAMIGFSYPKLLERVKAESLMIALAGYHMDINDWLIRFLKVWQWVFLVCVALGICGAGVLIVAWIRTLAVV